MKLGDKANSQLPTKNLLSQFSQQLINKKSPLPMGSLLTVAQPPLFLTFVQISLYIFIGIIDSVKKCLALVLKSG